MQVPLPPSRQKSDFVLATASGSAREVAKRRVDPSYTFCRRLGGRWPMMSPVAVSGHYARPA
eukprot:4113646-Prymnesium_polylepis.1